jgi:hypothetical protein
VSAMCRAALLDAELYEEIESDPRREWQAFVVVVIVSLAFGLGLGWPRLDAVVLGTLILFVGGWAVVSNWLGTRLFPEPGTESNLREMVRTIGFAATPGLLAPLALLFPEARLAVFSTALLWMLAATVTAVRQALDFASTARALLVCAVGWFVQVLAVALALFLLVATSRPLL